MKLRSPIQLTDADKARVAKLTKWLPRVKVTIPARENKAQMPKRKVYPY